ncbi:MAG: HupU protein [Gammaproteobacteria bacterium]|nr:HupU protein [Gammaproteobacteria bacterium]MCP5406172.1 HupU protein [Chromatiaceae bacterium]MCP5409777.1 HupU protein [Chromatiaceae bacterium]MCP5442729.1 HupU protein [Chromatiaceae bacterium]
MSAADRKRFNLLWLQSGGCGGCSLSLLCAESPNLLATLEGAGIEMIWHPMLSEASGSEMIDLLNRTMAGEIPLDALCIEGAIKRGPKGSGRFHMLSGSGRPMMHWVRDLAQVARYTLAIGTGASFGGITSGGDNPTDACGLQYSENRRGGLLGGKYLSGEGVPVINVAGCPTHPNWVLDTLMHLAAGGFRREDLDDWQRPRSYCDHLVHHGCPRNEFYEYKASAQQSSQGGCMMEHMGCLGTQAHADCNIRPWNGSGSCLKGGYACINCTRPGFQEPGHRFLETPKIAGIPIGLPTDMPKAWFVALASLSKAATPKRLRSNAHADHIVVPPSCGKRDPDE